MIATALATRGLRVAQASTSANALGLSLGEPPDLILMEHTLPEGGAVELLRQLRGSERTRTIKAAVMTRDPYAQDELSGAGFALVLVKPFDPRKAIVDIRRLVGCCDRWN
jgi:CheY-like chemotaxis protein